MKKEQKTLGIIAAPGLAKKIADTLIETLPTEINKALNENIKWNIETTEDSLTGSAETIEELFSGLETHVENENWDYYIALTDLPIYHENKVVAIDINEDNGASLISIPSFGWRPIKHRIEKTIVSLIKEVPKLKKGKSNSEKSMNSKILRGQFPLATLRLLKTKIKEDQATHTRLVIVPKVNGTLRLLVGMTFANNPLNMMSSLSNVIAIAFTTGAFGIIFTTMWQLSQVFSVLRLLSTTFVAIFGMVLWIIVAHSLWETSKSSKNKKITRLYNYTTVSTLLVSVTFYYLLLYLLFLFVSLVVLPSEFLGEILKLGKPASLTLYIKISWFAASISTVAGAMGAGLSNEELVRESTYGYRQKQRHRLKKKKAN